MELANVDQIGGYYRAILTQEAYHSFLQYQKEHRLYSTAIGKMVDSQPAVSEMVESAPQGFAYHGQSLER
jgi:hypothetical protein